MSTGAIRRRLFWAISRTGIFLYRRLPIFGSLRASVAVIREADRVLVIERHDGRGISFPGGIAFPWESDAEALRREVLEETGLHITCLDLNFRYFTAADVPCVITVFSAQAAGQVQESWEGLPCWLGVSELRARVLPSQKPIVENIATGR